MGIFIDMLDNFKKVNADLDEGDELSRFFGLLSKFNNGKMFNEQFKLKVEEFFDHKWNFDKNQAIDDEDEKEMLAQLPNEV